MNMHPRIRSGESIPSVVNSRLFQTSKEAVPRIKVDPHTSSRSHRFQEDIYTVSKGHDPDASSHFSIVWLGICGMR